MPEIVKSYELRGEGLSSVIFERAGFKKKESTEKHKHGTYYFSHDISSDGVEVQIEIDAFHPFDFDETRDVIVYDKTYERVFTAFYEEDRDYPYLNDLKKEYNRIMDSLVEKKIFVPKTKKENKTLINKE